MPTWLIALVGGLLFFCTVLPGAYLWWPKRGDPVRRIDLGLALLTGAIIGFSLLVLQLLIQVRSTHDEHARQAVATQLQFLSEIGKDKDLTGRDLHKQDLSSQYLAGKILKGAILSQAKLGKADLNDAHLEAADLTNADLTAAHLEGARLEQADARRAEFQGSFLASAVLDGADLSNANLQGAHLADASLRANLRDADLTGADLYGANLASANLKGANLEGAKLAYANLRGASLEGANLKGATFSVHGHLNRTYRSTATYDSTTVWTDGRTMKCAQPSPCWFPFAEPEAVPHLLTAFKRVLVAAERDRKGGVLGGWKADTEDPLGLTLFAPGKHAFLYVDSQGHLGMTLSQYAWALADEHKQCFSRTPSGCPRGLWLSLGGVPGLPQHLQAYAKRFWFAEGKRRMAAIGVYYVERDRGYRVWAAAEPDFFPLFQRDFNALFSALGSKQDLFPDLFPELSAKLAGRGGVNINFKPAQGKVCWQFGMRGIDPPVSASISTNGRAFIPLGTTFKRHACAAVSRARIEAVEMQPSAFWVTVSTKNQPNGVVRGRLVDGTTEVYGMPEL